MWPFPSAAPEAPKPTDSIRNRDIMLGDEHHRQRTRWTRLLIFYLRGLALFSLMRGVNDWAKIMGFLGPENAFEASPITWQVTIVLYAVLNCVASVGLWLTSAWGAVLWLIVTICEILLPWVTTNPARPAGIMDGILAAMVLTYVVLTVMSARERGRDH